ncbi:head-tail connector protein [Novosphingobium sp. BW1]|uniref:head-tail connector protein n=1 Tax=Novosphingobium sp. BW1 TaxID=2592621 RepID=UPI0011DE85CC|nr:head-tail connector protein [Novosphingobium sp. BW1]TYC93042.1 hypothetical protein FMM79_03380 [Novosphingobium sp. BW1]
MRVFVIMPPAPASKPSLEDVKAHLRVEHDDQDQLIQGYIDAAFGHIDGPDGWLGRAFAVQTLEARLPSFGTCGAIELPYPPATAIESIEYIDADGGTTTLDPSGYELTGNLLRPAWPGTFPAASWRGADGETVRIRWIAGYATLPAPVRAALLLMVGDMYRFPETVSDQAVSKIPMSTTAEKLLQPFRVYR